VFKRNEAISKSNLFVGLLRLCCRHRPGSRSARGPLGGRGAFKHSGRSQEPETPGLGHLHLRCHRDPLRGSRPHLEKIPEGKGKEEAGKTSFLNNCT